MKSIYGILLAIALSQAMSAQGTKTVVLDNTDPRPAGCVPAYSNTKKVFVCTVISATGTLGGDVTGTIVSNTVAMVGGQSASTIASGAVRALAGTSAATPNTLVARDSTGEFYGIARTARSLITGDTLPSTCVVGELFFRTAVTPGQNVYGCPVTNTWSLQAGGGGGGAAPAGTVGQVQTNNGAGGFAAVGFSGSGLFLRQVAPQLSGVATGEDPPPESSNRLATMNSVDNLMFLRLGSLSSPFVAIASSRTAPAKLVTTLPATCSVGDVVFKTDATAGQNLQFCTALNTWSAMTAGGGGVGTSANGQLLANTSGSVTGITINTTGSGSSASEVASMAALSASLVPITPGVNDNMTAVVDNTGVGILKLISRLDSFVFDGGGAVLTPSCTVDKLISASVTKRFDLLSISPTSAADLIGSTIVSIYTSPSMGSAWTLAGTASLTAASRAEVTLASTIAANSWVMACVGSTTTIQKLIVAPVVY